MLTVTLKRSLSFAQEQIEKTKHLADCYELRLDTFVPLNFSDIQTLVQSFDQPFIFTLRKENQGGWFSNDVHKQMQVFHDFLVLKPTYIDLEYDTPLEEIEKIKSRYPSVRLISSFHDFRQSYRDLEKLFAFVFRYQVDVYKLVTDATSSLDALNMLKFSSLMRDKGILFTGICLGEKGVMTRILGPVFGNVINYASSDEEGKVAQGQLPCQDLCDTYHFKELSRQTKIYALIGNPVSQSISHLSHNKIFKYLQKDAVYVKIELKKEEVQLFLDQTLNTPFEGLSVTIPFKELVYQGVYHHDNKVKKIKAVNTLKKINSHWFSTNTDAEGALEAIEEFGVVENKTCIVIGAGGTAKAIVFEALKRGAKVKILNRTYEKAKALAQEFQIEAYDYKNLQDLFNEKYHILINTTPIGMHDPQQSPLSAVFIDPTALVMDVVFKVKETKFLKDAKNKGCQVIYGYKMFAYQAIKQFMFWLDSPLEKQTILSIIESYFK